MKSSFTKNFAKEQLAKKRTPMVARIETDATIIDFELSFPQTINAYRVHIFLNELANGKKPEAALRKAFSPGAVTGDSR